MPGQHGPDDGAADVCNQASVLSPSEFEEINDTIALIDVREERDYRSVGHLPDAVNIPINEFRDIGGVATGLLPERDSFLETLGDAGIAEDNDIVAYDGGKDVMAARFLLTAAVYGHEGRLYLLEGGYDAWATDRRTVTGRVSADPTDYESALTGQSSITATRSDVEAAIDDPDVELIDTRTTAEYEAAHVPGATCLSRGELLDDSGRLLPPERRKEVLEARGIAPDQDVILYCNTARRLAHVFVALQDLGWTNLQVYEGSLTDWIRAEAPQWDPIELKRRVIELADGGFDAVVDAMGEDVVDRLKLVGLYEQKQSGYFMLRTKIPGGELTAAQAQTIGEVADEFARAPAAYGGAEQNDVWRDGYLDFTTRQDVQMHWVQLSDMPEIWRRYDAVGLSTHQACGNSVRNVVACPTAGVDTHELLDVRDLVDDITERFEGDRRYANLPRKLKVSITGCRENCGRAQINDLGFTPARKDSRVGFHVAVGGGLSDGPRVASDLDAFVPPDRVVDVVEAVADVFVEQGNYLDTAVNRLRFLVEALGDERFREEVDRRLAFELERGGTDATERYRGDHVGVHEQADGRYYVGLTVPVGRMSGDHLVNLADLATVYGTRKLRLTPNQNVLVPNVPPERVEDLRAYPLLDRYSPDPDPFTRGALACTGKEYCSYGIVETKQRAYRWAGALDELLGEHVDEPVRVHLSGCSASCAQPQIADIGLRGEILRDSEGSHPAVDVGFGGDLGRDQFVDWVAGRVPVESVPEIIEAVQRQADGDLTEWLAETPREQLREIVATTQDRYEPAGSAEPRRQGESR